ncbi:unnamed protein product [Sympodiomycopsis kandeliae]
MSSPLQAVPWQQPSSQHVLPLGDDARYSSAVSYGNHHALGRLERICSSASVPSTLASASLPQNLAPPPSSWSQIKDARQHSGVCGKRSRSNSSSSSGASSDGESSIFLSSSGSSLVESPATSLSGQSSQDSDEEQDRSCPSPSAGKRKAVRRAWRHDACTAAPVAHSPTSASAKGPTSVNGSSSSSSGHGSSLSSSPSSNSDLDVTGLRGAVQAFGLSSREHTPDSNTSSLVSTERSHTVEPSATADLAALPSKGNLVDHLVDAAVATIDAIWHSPLTHTEQDVDVPPCTASALPLSLFIREALRRSRTSCSTLQAALLYCLRCAPAVRKQRIAYQNMTRAQPDDRAAHILADRANPLLCGRRIFLASVMVASKFLQDKTFSNKAWSRLTGLPLKQLGLVEREFLAAIGWDLNVKPAEWDRWVRKLTEAKCNRTLEAVPQEHNVSTATPMVSSVHKALTAVKATADEGQDRSGSSTPTPTPLQPRANLVRIHSDDGPLKAYDASLSATPSQASPNNAPMQNSLSRQFQISSQEATPTIQDDGKVPLTASVPYPYPMPRAFVRSAHSFSSGTDRLAALHGVSS